VQPPELHLPEPNPFVPSELGLLPAAPPRAPQLLEEGPQLRLWHKQEGRFGVPKAVVYLDFQVGGGGGGNLPPARVGLGHRLGGGGADGVPLGQRCTTFPVDTPNVSPPPQATASAAIPPCWWLQCPEAYSSPTTSVMTRLFAKLLADYLNEVAQHRRPPARLGGAACGQAACSPPPPPAAGGAAMLAKQLPACCGAGWWPWAREGGGRGGSMTCWWWAGLLAVAGDRGAGRVCDSCTGAASVARLSVVAPCR
jgi:hypothetical protein